VVAARQRMAASPIFDRDARGAGDFHVMCSLWRSRAPQGKLARPHA
jgi:hypothetical protein